MSSNDRHLAIIGIGLRLPGANNKQEFYNLLRSKRSGISRVPADRWNVDTFTGPGKEPTKIVTDLAGFLDEYREFDALDFGISPNEANELDVHQYMLLQTTLQAFEDSGVKYRGTKTGVFVSGSFEARSLQTDEYDVSAYTSTGTALCMQANRVSFFFDLRGPSIFIDTACSGGLTAMHTARNAILAGDCDQAVVAGISIMLTPQASQGFSKLGTLSPTGCCHAFDAAADGYVRGEGCVVIIVKRLDAALKEGDHVYAVLTGSAVNANGRGLSLTMPDAKMQMDATLQAYKDAGRDPTDAFFVECHGTGTPVGDPIEINTLGQVFSRNRPEGDILSIGSVKTNIGHLETASGLVGLIKAAMILDSGVILPGIHFNTPNPQIHWSDFRIRVQTDPEPIPEWKRTADGMYVASVSSFGFGGANAHAVLERMPHASGDRFPDMVIVDKDPILIAVGGLSARSLGRVVANVREFLEGATDPRERVVISRVFGERARGHPFLSYAVIPASGTSQLEQAFSKAAAPLFTTDPFIAFVFSGQGPQYPQMGRRLFYRFKAFRDSVLASDAVLQSIGFGSFLKKYGMFDSYECTLRTGPDASWPVEAVVLSIVIFQIALYDLWKSLNVAPSVVLGHSVGEIAAMYASGAINRRKAVHLAVARAMALKMVENSQGGMAALGCDEAQANEMIGKVLTGKREGPGGVRGLWISAVNSVKAVSVSGNEDLIVKLVQQAETRGIFARQLRVGGAYHSPLVDVCASAFQEAVLPVLDSSRNIPRTRFISTVHGKLFQRDQPLDTAYCWENIRKPVLFADAIKAMFKEHKEEGNASSLCVIEMAPHPVLQGYIGEIAASVDVQPAVVVACARRPNPKAGEGVNDPVEDTQFLDTVGKLLVAGVRNVNLRVLTGLADYDVPMGHDMLLKKPVSYPFQKTIVHHKEHPTSAYRRTQPPAKPLCTPLFRISPQTHPWVTGHIISKAVIFPGTGYIEAALEHGARTVRNVRIRRALMLSEHEPAKYVGFRETGINNEWEFCSSSKNVVNDAGVMLDTVHATGQFVMEAVYTPKTAIEHLGQDFMSEFDLVMDGQRFYQIIAGTGAEYSGVFAMITEIRGSSTREKDYIAFVEVSDELWNTHARGMVLHPALLDCACQTGWGMSLFFNDTRTLVDTYMPSEISYISLTGTNDQIRSAKRILIHCEDISYTDRISLQNLYLFDADTLEMLVVVEGKTSHMVRKAKKVQDAYTAVWEPRFLSIDRKVLDVKWDDSSWMEVHGKVLRDGREQPLVEALERVKKEGQEGLVNDDLFDRIYQLPAFTTAIETHFKQTLQKLISNANDRRVLRILDLYIHKRRLNWPDIIASTTPHIHLDIVGVNLAGRYNGTDHTRFDVRAGVESEPRCRPESFDVVVGGDVLRFLGDGCDVFGVVLGLLVPGGYVFTSDLNATTLKTRFPILGDIFTNTPTPPHPPNHWKTTLTNTLFIEPQILESVGPHFFISAQRDPTRTCFEYPKEVPPSVESESDHSSEDLETLSSDGSLSCEMNSDLVEGCVPTTMNGTSKSEDKSQEEKIWMALGKRPHIDSPLPCSQPPLYSLDATTLVYHYHHGTEMQLVHSIQNLGENPTGTIWILTEDTPTGAMGQALSATLTNEYPNLTSYAIIFPQSTPITTKQGWLDVLMEAEKRGGVEPFTCVRGTRLFSRRIVSVPRIDNEKRDGDWVLDLKTDQMGVNALAPHRYFPPALHAHAVQIRVQAVALNFKNVLSAAGLLPDTDRLSEFAGVVSGVGSKVSRVVVGDRVMGTTGASREGSVAVTSEWLVSKIPDTMNMMEAAAFPIAYGTVWYALIEKAQIRPGETVLIHSAAGGVGLSAIQVARRVGCQVFCTVGSTEKREFIHKGLGVDYDAMSTSRSTETWMREGQAWLAKRGRKGFDVVLNSLQGTALQAGCAMLAPLGRFIDISKRDALSGTPISMSHFAKATSYIAIELGSLSKFHPESMSQLLDTIISQHTQTPFTFLYHHGFRGIEGLTEAYRLMESGQHIGKIVVDLSLQKGVMNMYRPRPLFDPRKSYILVGGCGGLGPRLAVNLFANGARNVILTGRRGIVDRVDRLTLESFIGDEQYTGAQVRFMAADACDEHAMKKVVDAANAMGPIGGIFLMSVVLADDLFVNMTPEKFATVNKSKIGALDILEKVVSIGHLDFLFLFSSTAALFFNPGQANYNAAQSFFDRYARDCHNVISFAVPAISDIGVFAALRASKNNATLKVLDTLACTSSELCDQIQEAVARTLTGCTQHVPYLIPELNWRVSYGISPANQTSIAHLVTHGDDQDHEQESTSEDPVGALITRILNVDVSAVEDTVHLSSLGLDSLTASRLSGVLESELGVHVSQLQLLGPVSVRALRDLAHVSVAKKNAVTDGVDSQQLDDDKRQLAFQTDSTFDCVSQVDALDHPSISAAGLIVTGVHLNHPTIFLTGATGFLGRSILSALFDRFPNATIACLVRASTPQQGTARIQTACEKAQVWKQEWRDRIKVILGDCAHEHLGMSDGDWEWVAKNVEWIVHAAGVADHLKPYASLSVNSTSTKEILCLATTLRLKAVQYISSTNLFAFSGLETISESHNIHDLDPKTFTGYAQSKWISEVLCERARGRGVPVMVIRPGTLGGSSQTGVLHLDSFIWRFVLAVCEMGMAPDTPFLFSVTPVDWCAAMIVALGASEQAWNDPIFHINNPEMLTWADLPSIIPDGVPPCKIIPLKEWQTEFETQVQNNTRNPMVPLAHLVRQANVVLPRFLGENSRRVLGEGFVECPRTSGEVGKLYGRQLLAHFMASKE
ncbi:hypothetical protein SpCBS45565_g05228 [Spizellomyces sp. 'palustris']|nr:hypothetical protein SpCBS45565_g05228 [Spizellomyces sp. 'palustris']